MSDISRHQDDDGNRWYVCGDDKAMSVTTVLSFLDEDTTGLKYWKRANDGTGDNAYHQHLYWFSGPRGTLCHYQVLNQFADEELWGTEERRSLDKMTTGMPLPDETADSGESLRESWRDDNVPVDETEIVYSIFNNKEIVSGRDEFDAFFDDTDLVDVCYRDVEWFADTFDTVATDLGIDDDSVVSVERFLLSESGYGGQCDLVYESPDGETVLADLKTSSSLRQKHRLQSVAYAAAVEAADDIAVDAVDRVEVIRLHPDTKTYEVHSHDVPEYASDLDYYTDEHWFDDEYNNFEYDSLDEMLDTFMELVTTAHETVEYDD